VQADAGQPFRGGLHEVDVDVDARDVLGAEAAREQRAAVSRPGADAEHVHVIGEPGVPVHRHDQAGPDSRSASGASRTLP